MRSSTCFLHHSLILIPIPLIFDGSPERSIHDYVDVARITTIRWAQINIVCCYEAYFDGEMSKDVRVRVQEPSEPEQHNLSFLPAINHLNHQVEQELIQTHTLESTTH